MPGDKSWTSLVEWAAALRDLHARARQGKLSPAELRNYREEREALSKAIIAAQRLRAAPGARARQSLRIARELPAQLGVEGARKLNTIDVGSGGFAVMMAKPPRAGEMVRFSLELEPGETIAGRGRVVSLQRKGAAFRVAVQFENLPPDDVERVEIAVFEAALEAVLPEKR